MFTEFEEYINKNITALEKKEYEKNQLIQNILNTFVKPFLTKFIKKN